MSETAHWWVEVTSPGGPGRFQPGFSTELHPDPDSRRLAQALVDALGPLLIPGDGPLSRLTASAVTTYLTSYGRLLLGRRNADALGLPDSKPFQAAVLATAVINRALEYARIAVPGANRLDVFDHAKL